MYRVNIIGAGLAGLSAAIRLAKMQIGCNLISVQDSERAQSVLAEGGINAAMDVSGESDTAREHCLDTLQGGVFLADPAAVRGLAQTASQIVRELMELGVPFNMEGDRLLQRRFGGQKKTRTAYARSSTGKALMTAMIDAVRRYEAELPAGPLVVRYPHHRFVGLLPEKHSDAEKICRGVRVLDLYTGRQEALRGPVILAFGGPNGLFPGRTTGTTANDGCALATVFSQGVALANLEFIQYHPTTVQIAGKRMLVSEAARGEGGRLYVMRGGEKWYFMEEKYPELGNLMPRDVVSREMDAILREAGENLSRTGQGAEELFHAKGTGGGRPRPEAGPGWDLDAARAKKGACRPPVYLDLTQLPARTWQKKLPDLRREIIHYLAIDPAREPVPVSPGIHFFMGGILVDRDHRANMAGLYAAGECACQYHGANRLGGNSLLGALYGGRVAADALAKDMQSLQMACGEAAGSDPGQDPDTGPARMDGAPACQDAEQALQAGLYGGEKTEGRGPEAGGSQDHISAGAQAPFSARLAQRVAAILSDGLGIVRDEAGIDAALDALSGLEKELSEKTGGLSRDMSMDRRMDFSRLMLARAFLVSARARRESRGAHVRADYRDRDDTHYRKTTVATCENGDIRISFREI